MGKVDHAAEPSANILPASLREPTPTPFQYFALSSPSMALFSRRIWNAEETYPTATS